MPIASACRKRMVFEPINPFIDPHKEPGLVFAVPHPGTSSKEGLILISLEQNKNTNSNAVVPELLQGKIFKAAG
jgi:hypothetical protein